MSSCAVIDESNSVFGESEIRAISPIKRQASKTNTDNKFLIRSGSVASKQSMIPVAENKNRTQATITQPHAKVRKHAVTNVETPAKNTTQQTCVVNSTNHSNKALPPSTCLVDDGGPNEKRWRKLQVLNDSSEKLKYEKSKANRQKTSKQITPTKESLKVNNIAHRKNTITPTKKSVVEESAVSKPKTKPVIEKPVNPNKEKETEEEILRLQRKMVKLQNKISQMQSRVTKLQTTV